MNPTPGGKNLPNPGGFKPPKAECEVGLETAPSPLHPGACEGSRAPDRHLNAPLEAACRTRDLKTEPMHILSGCSVYSMMQTSNSKQVAFKHKRNESN